MALDPRISVNPDGSYFYSGSILSGVGDRYEHYATCFPRDSQYLNASVLEGEAGGGSIGIDRSSNFVRYSRIDTTKPYIYYTEVSSNHSSGRRLEPRITPELKRVLLKNIILDWELNRYGYSEGTVTSYRGNPNENYLFKYPYGRHGKGWNENGRHGKGVRKCLTYAFHNHHAQVDLYMRIEGYLFYVGFVRLWDRAQEYSDLHRTRVDLHTIKSLLVIWANTGRQATLFDSFEDNRGEYHDIENTLVLSI